MKSENLELSHGRHSQGLCVGPSTANVEPYTPKIWQLGLGVRFGTFPRLRLEHSTPTRSSTDHTATDKMATELTVQSERAFQKQPHSEFCLWNTAATASSWELATKRTLTTVIS
jgi:hypothetical protein